MAITRFLRSNAVYRWWVAKGIAADCIPAEGRSPGGICRR